MPYFRVTCNRIKYTNGHEEPYRTVTIWSEKGNARAFDIKYIRDQLGLGYSAELGTNAKVLDVGSMSVRSN